MSFHWRCGLSVGAPYALLSQSGDGWKEFGCCVAGCTYALVDVIPNAVRNRVVGTVCAVNCRSSIISSAVYPMGREAYSSKAKAEMKTVPRNT